MLDRPKTVFAPISQPHATPHQEPTVVYDGSSPMCRSEIGFCQRQLGADGVTWVDVSADEREAIAPGLTTTSMMARIHVIDSAGNVLSEAGAFTTLRTALPALSVAGRIANLPGIRHALEAGCRAILPVQPWLQRRAHRS
jgi:predicted DCC family thiol-disulfide oxidoreductase YuxK